MARPFDELAGAPTETGAEAVKRLKDPIWFNVKNIVKEIIEPQKPSKGFYYLSRIIYQEIKK